MGNENILEDIKRFSGLGKLSIFVGAGVSRLSGYPSWIGLVQEMANEIGYSYGADKDGYANFSSEELLKIPQMYYLSKGEEIYRNKVESGFSNSCTPNEIHDLIMSLNPKHMLTTNYDTLLEETAIKFGRNFSIMNSNKVVSNAETTDYIVKVHGDFSTDFVLKEQDYLDYENNYVLIDNIVKTIFATNLVVFIGYGLTDYNIKLILNWVKNVQSDSFVMPVFIHTGDKLNNLELIYQKGRGLRVLDYNDYINDTDFSDYSKRYSSVLKKILSYNNEVDLSARVDKLQYLYNKIMGIKNLIYIGREGFNNLFRGEYELNSEWYIVNKTTVTNTKLDYFEDFYANEEEYKIINKEYYNEVKRFIKNCEINGIENQASFSFSDIKISNAVFGCDFEGLYQFCQKEYTLLSENFRKAYYLAQLGEYVASYNLYTNILDECKQKEQWDLYYLSQINRSYLFSIINQLQALTTGSHGIINWGRQLQMFDEEFIERLNNEMGNHQLKNQFLELPYEFKSKYSFLSNFSKRNCYINKYYELVKEKYDVEKELTKDVTYFGLSKFDNLKLKMLETTKFIYDNMILFSRFNENKLYIKNSLIAWLESYEKEITKNRNNTINMFSNSRYKFTLTDIILIAKNFKKDDIEYLIGKVDLKVIWFDQSKELESHILKQINNYSEIFTATLTGGKIFLWKIYSEEIKILLSIAPYFVNDNACKLSVIQFIINMSDRQFDVSDRIRIINKWIWIAKPDGANVFIENWLLEKLKIIQNSFIDDIEHKLSDVSIIARLLSNMTDDCEYSCKAISDFLIMHEGDIDCFTPCFNDIYPILNDESRKVIDDKHIVTDVYHLMRRVYAGNFPKNSDEHIIVESFLSKTLKAKEDNGKNGITKYSFPSVDDRIHDVAVYMVIRDFPIEISKKYYGISKEYDFLLNPKEFNQTDFEIEWLLTYNDELYKKMENSEIQKQIIVNAIEKAFKDTSFSQQQLRRLFSIYKSIIHNQMQK